MKFMLMMQGTQAGWESMYTWPLDDIKDHIRFMKSFSQQLAAAGELVEAQGLAVPAQAKVVRATASGVPEVTDGPFPEAKEFLAGFWIVDCESPERAIQIAAQASVAPGPGGLPMNLAIEIREVMSGPPVDV